MSDVIDPGSVVEPDDSFPVGSDDSSDDDLSIFEIDGDYNPEETDGKVH